MQHTQPFCAHYPSKILRAGEEAWMGKSIYLPHEPDDLSLIPRAHNRRREWTTTLSLMPGDMQDVHLNLQQEPDGGVESAQPLNLHAFGGQSGSAASCRLGGISRSFESHGWGTNVTLRGSPFLLIFPFVLVGMTWRCITGSSAMLTVPCAGNSICGRP